MRQPYQTECENEPILKPEAASGIRVYPAYYRINFFLSETAPADGGRAPLGRTPQRGRPYRLLFAAKPTHEVNNDNDQ